MLKIIRRLLGFRSQKIQVAVEREDDMAWLVPPCEVHDAGPWDRYWRAQVENGIGPQLHDMFCEDNLLLSAMEARGLSTVLCVGNGISQEPHALAAAGMNVTALDISPVAIHLASRFALEPTDLGQFFDPNRTRPGGTVKFVVGDLLDSTVCPGPFDVAIERRTLQLFPEQERSAALRAVATRLSPEGILLTHCHDGGWRPPRKPKHVIEPLLGASGFSIAHHGSPVDRRGRIAFVVESTG